MKQHRPLKLSNNFKFLNEGANEGVKPKNEGVTEGAIEIKAPEPRQEKEDYKDVFLAGSIEMGKAEDWQKKIFDKLKDEKIVFYNPRRDDWDSSWKQEKEDKQFSEQVNWELDNLEEADKIVMYLDPETKSPISLLELGLFARSGKLIVYCPDGFYRKGNVDIVCDKYGVKMVNSFEELEDELKG